MSSVVKGTSDATNVLVSVIYPWVGKTLTRKLSWKVTTGLPTSRSRSALAPPAELLCTGVLEAIPSLMARTVVWWFLRLRLSISKSPRRHQKARVHPPSHIHLLHRHSILHLVLHPGIYPIVLGKTDF
jgi:hypothetical protein